MHARNVRLLSRRGQIGLRQTIKNTAGSGDLAFLAATAQLLEVALQALKLSDATGDMFNVLVEELIHLTTVFRGRFAEVQQRADFVQRHVQAAAVTDKGELFQVCVRINSVVALRPARFGQQSFALVIAHRLDIGIGQFGQFAYFHMRA